MNRSGGDDLVGNVLAIQAERLVFRCPAPTIKAGLAGQPAEPNW